MIHGLLQLGVDELYVASLKSSKNLAADDNLYLALSIDSVERILFDYGP